MEQDAITTTSLLSAAQTAQIMDAIDTGRMERLERRVDMQSAALDAERDTRRQQVSALQDKLDAANRKLRTTIAYAEQLRGLVPPPPPEYPSGWANIHHLD